MILDKKTTSSLILLLFACGCITTKPVQPMTLASDMPPLPPGMEMMAPIRTMAQATQPPQPVALVIPGEWLPCTLAWNYDVSRTNVINFRIYGGQTIDRSDWTVKAETHQLRVTLPGKQMEFFGVKAFDVRVPQVESDWGTTQ